MWAIAVWAVACIVPMVGMHETAGGYVPDAMDSIGGAAWWRRFNERAAAEESAQEWETTEDE